MINSKSILEIDSISKNYDEGRGINEVSFSLTEGDMLGIFGKNGSGKSTLLKIICGSLLPDTGYGTFLGKDLLNNSQCIKENIGYVPQESGLYFDLTVKHNLIFFAKIYNVNNYLSRVDYLIERFSLHDFANVQIKSLSGGWRQRVQLAICLLHDPRMIVLDEPMIDLDKESQAHLWQLLYECSQEKKIILMVTHDFSHEVYFNKLLLMKNGRSHFFIDKKKLINNQGLRGVLFKGRNFDDLISAIKNISTDIYCNYTNEGIKVIYHTFTFLSKIRLDIRNRYEMEETDIGTAECIEYLCLS